MKMWKKTLLIWLSFISVGGGLLRLLPNDKPFIASLCMDGVQLLAGIVCLFLFLKEPTKSNKPIFFNFAALFFLSIVSFSYKFVGEDYFILSNSARYYMFQYHILAYNFLLALAVLYVVVDSLFNDLRIRWKYSTAILIVAATFTYYYHPFIENPRYLATTEDWIEYGAITKSIADLRENGNANPSISQIAAKTELGIWQDGKKVGLRFEHERAKRVAELSPYLEDGNWPVLLYRPLYLSNIYMNVLCIVFIFLFFGYQYKKDPPQGAYIEKIIFLFLPYCSLEILHHYAYIKSVQYQTFADVQQIGGYLTLVNLALLLVFFSLRLRFITSVKGEFYERELVSDAEHISRWRDAFDNLVVRHFLNPKAVHGRLFAPRAPRTKT